jgi:integrase
MELAKVELYLLSHGYSAQTVKDTLSRLRTLERKIGVLTHHSVMHFIADSRETLTNNSINVYLKAIKLYAKALDIEELQGIKSIPENATARTTLGVDELRRFLSTTAPHSNNGKCNYGLYFALVALTGMRCGECAKLTAKDISWGEGLIYLTETKTKSPRRIPIPPNLLKALELHCAGKTGKLFPTNGQLWNTAFHYRLKLAGINRPGVTPHSLRRSYITHMLRQPGINLFDVKAIVGHKSSQTTEIYYSLDGERLKQVIPKHPCINNTLTVEERARYVCDLIRSIGLEYEPQLEPIVGGLKVSLVIRPPPQNRKPPSDANL